jgi:hypothetical protein
MAVCNDTFKNSQGRTTQLPLTLHDAKDSKSPISWWRLKPRTISRVSRKHATENNTQPPKVGRALLLLLRLVELGCVIGHIGDFLTLGFCTTAASASRLVGGYAWDALLTEWSPGNYRRTFSWHRTLHLLLFVGHWD